MAIQSVQPAVSKENSTTRQPYDYRRANKLAYWASFVLLVLLALLWILPLLWAIDTSLKPETETTTIPITWLSSHFTLDAFTSTLANSQMWRWYFNSTLTSGLISLLTIFLASLAAFAFSRIPFRGNRIVFWVILAGIMVPGQILIVPLFTEMQSFGLVDTYWGIILPQIASPVAVFILKQYFDGIPAEFEEAALLDGASRLNIYWRIWMPLARPALAAVAIFTFVISWNNFLWPFIVISNNNMMTLPVGLATVQTSFGIRYAQIMATALLGGIPVLIVFLCFQKQIVQGIAGTTGLKG
ncbi:carbohydrate ABC transporter permease [Ktedonobacter racemifer]|uniref:Binding-protein-dependent transport systems inner membrane component n=1 Tax=Ktedonobacter racemifer DSM 44963 TaxID=485913 RepID=D6TUD6_KTERA|nr:carbohydrate ABC transporter permease [Ktedonobacter racemifer]EFH84004.1 binding-protein-dependent transport systems inner membrane component [Ktedonobacter racemifer DSM 44963]